MKYWRDTGLLQQMCSFIYLLYTLVPKLKVNRKPLEKKILKEAESELCMHQKDESKEGWKEEDQLACLGRFSFIHIIYCHLFVLANSRLIAGGVCGSQNQQQGSTDAEPSHLVRLHCKFPDAACAAVGVLWVFQTGKGSRVSWELHGAAAPWTRGQWGAELYSLPKDTPVGLHFLICATEFKRLFLSYQIKWMNFNHFFPEI